MARVLRLFVLLVFVASLHIFAQPPIQSLEILQPNNIAQIETLRMVGSPLFGHFLSVRWEEGNLVYQQSPDDDPIVLPTNIDETRLIDTRTVSPDGHYIAISFQPIDEEGTYDTVVWSIESNPAKQIIGAKGKAINWRPDSRQIAIDSSIYDVQIEEHIFDHVSEARSGSTEIDWCDGATETTGGDPKISWSPDSTQYAAIAYYICASSRIGYGIFDADDGSLIVELSNSEYDTIWTTLSWNSSGTMVNRDARTWSASSGLPVAWLRYDRYQAIDLPSTSWIPNSNDLLSVQRDGWDGATLRIYKWDGTSGLVIFEAEFRNASVSEINHDTIVVGVGFARIILDAGTGEFLRTEPTEQPFGRHIAISPDSSKLLLVDDGPPDPFMQMWDMNDLLTGDDPAPIWQANGDWFSYEAQLQDYVVTDSIAIWLNVDEFFTYVQNFASYDLQDAQPWGRIQRWDANTGEALAEVYWSQDLDKEHFVDELVRAVPNQDLTRIAEFVQPDTIRILDAKTLEEQLQLTGTTLPEKPTGFWSPSGDRLAVIEDWGGYGTNEFILWHLEQPNNSQIMVVEDAPEINRAGDIREIQWHPTEDYLATMQRYQMTIINVDSNQALNTITSDSWVGVYGAIWNPAGTLMVSATNNLQILLFHDVTGATELARFTMPRNFHVEGWQWSPDGRLLILTDGFRLLLLGVPAS